MKRLLRIVRYLITAGAVFLLGSNIWVFLSTYDQVITDIDQIPQAQVALVLGTSPNTSSGRPNPYFEQRMTIAARLYKLGKVKHILVSGDNGSRYYNEPEKMKQALIDRGVPPHAITMDYAGFRTLDSIVRCKKVFDQDNIIIVTNSFHAYRALFIGNYYDMRSTALAAPHSSATGKIKLQIREFLARSLAVWDLYIIGTKPKFLGKKETLEL